MKRLLKIGPLEIWGKEREEPNDFTRAGEAMDNFKKVFYDEIFEPVLDWFKKQIFILRLKLYGIWKKKDSIWVYKNKWIKIK